MRIKSYRGFMKRGIECWLEDAESLMLVAFLVSKRIAVEAGLVLVQDG
jgi:hypothetical protein